MEMFRCYCFDNEGNHGEPKDFNNSQDALTFVSEKMHLYPRVLVTDALDCTVYEAIDGKMVFPKLEEGSELVNKINVLIVEPHKEPYTAEIENTLKAMQDVVGGLIEMVALAEGETLVCNEEGKLLGLEGNRTVGNDIIAGNIFIAGDNEDGELISLSEEQIQRYSAMFKEPELYTKEQVESSINVKIINFNPSNTNPPTFDELCSKYINKLNKDVLPNVNYRDLQESYQTDDKTYAKTVLKKMHDIFVDMFDTDTINGHVDDFITLPAIIKGRNTGEICIGLVDIDLSSSGEHWCTDFMTKYGITEQGGGVSKEISNFISKKYMPYDYYYTIGVENDIHVDFDNMPEDVMDMFDFCNIDQEQTNGMDFKGM